MMRSFVRLLEKIFTALGFGSAVGACGVAETPFRIEVTFVFKGDWVYLCACVGGLVPHTNVEPKRQASYANI